MGAVYRSQTGRAAQTERAKWVGTTQVQDLARPGNMGSPVLTLMAPFMETLGEKNHPLSGPSVPLLSGSPEHHFRKKEQANSEVH